MVTDPIADFIVRLRNASAVGKPTVTVGYSNLKMAIADTLLAAGLIKGAVKKGKKIKKSIEIELAYRAVGGPKISRVIRVSKPSRRVYLAARAIRPFRQGYGQIIISTPRGVLTGEAARRAKVGGEVLFKVW